MSSKVVEIEEKTIDVAIARACQSFGVSREKLNIEIISEGSSGFLGLMSKKAKIRASLLSLEMDFALDSPKPVWPSTSQNEIRPQTRPPVPPEARPQLRPVEPSGSKPQTKPPVKVEPRQRRPDNGQKPPQRQARPQEPTRPPVKPRIADGVTNQENASATEMPAPRPLVIPEAAAVVATTPAALQARDMLAAILEKMTFACEVRATETDDTIILSVIGDENGLLIGRRGQNLDALQYILNKAINKSDTGRKMIVVDSEDYRKRRQESLLSMAERIREKVHKTQKPLSLAHMNAHDRRIIHLALQEDETLVTKSRGEGEFRKVIVLPAKKANGGGSSRPRNRQ